MYGQLVLTLPLLYMHSFLFPQVFVLNNSQPNRHVSSQRRPCVDMGEMVVSLGGDIVSDWGLFVPDC